jgi:hypothetical protein
MNWRPHWIVRQLIANIEQTVELMLAKMDSTQVKKWTGSYWGETKDGLEKRRVWVGVPKEEATVETTGKLWNRNLATRHWWTTKKRTTPICTIPALCEGPIPALCEGPIRKGRGTILQGEPLKEGCQECSNGIWSRCVWGWTRNVTIFQAHHRARDRDTNGQVYDSAIEVKHQTLWGG